MTQIKLYNTLTRRKEILRPIQNNRVTIYTCGPTVYNYAHIGNWRTFLFEDVLRRALEYFNYNVDQVMNITDVGHLTSDADEGEDKMEKSARLSGKSPWEIARFYTRAFFEDLRVLNVETPEQVPRATAHIADMIQLISRLERKGFTYNTSSGVYYDISKFPRYGALAHINISGQRAGARVQIRGEKKHPLDFALWITNQPAHIMQWNSPWGKGFPGWHIECSALAMSLLGETIDIHAGGIDHIGIHHTNEIAQSEGASGKKFAKIWMHGAFLSIARARMGKSKGNFLTVRSLVEKDIDPLAYRYLTLTAHYRKPLAFSWNALSSASRALEKLHDFIYELSHEYAHHAQSPGGTRVTVRAKRNFVRAIADDLNMPQALAAMWMLIRDVKAHPDRYQSSVIVAALQDFDRVFGLELGKRSASRSRLPARIVALMHERKRARANRNWAKADELRQEIEHLGYSVRDLATSSVVKENNHAHN